MRIEVRRIGFWLGAVAALGCGGSISGNGPMTGQGAQTGTGQGGQGGGTSIPCEAMGACECLAAGGRCTALQEACWCPSECAPPGTAIDCICGGGRFLACQESSVITPCLNELTAVQAKCANQSFVQYIAGICTNTRYDPICVAACLADLKTTGACTEIDCYFCPVCDCAVPTMPSPFRDCLSACLPPLPEGAE
jgi:hypothetical protein